MTAQHERRPMRIVLSALDLWNDKKVCLKVGQKIDKHVCDHDDILTEERRWILLLLQKPLSCTPSG